MSDPKESYLYTGESNGSALREPTPPVDPPSVDTRKLRELLAKATYTPWTRSIFYSQLITADSQRSVAETRQPKHRPQEEFEANIELIIAAVNALPALLAALESRGSQAHDR